MVHNPNGVIAAVGSSLHTPKWFSLPRNVAIGKLPVLSCIRGRRGAQPGVKRPTTHSAFELLYMILYIGGGHTAGCAVLAFVCLQ